jgi:hypothetical protein
VLVKLEIMVSDVVIRTEVKVEHLAGVILNRPGIAGGSNS